MGESISDSSDEGEGECGDRKRNLARRRSSVKDKIAALGLDRNSNETPAEKLGITRSNSKESSKIKGNYYK